MVEEANIQQREIQVAPTQVVSSSLQVGSGGGGWHYKPIKELSKQEMLNKEWDVEFCWTLGAKRAL